MAYQLSMCMKDPGPCKRCGGQHFLMYAYFDGKKRVSDPICQPCFERAFSEDYQENQYDKAEGR